MAEAPSSTSSDGLRPSLTPSSSFKTRKKFPSVARVGSDVDDLIALLHGSDPVKIELNRLENEVRDKDRELADAQAEIKASKYSERLKEKAVEELSAQLKRVEEKLKATEVLLDNRNLEIKRINDEKKAALAAQFAAEATLRRVHAAQKDDDMPPIEAIITPLEAELKLARLEAAKLQDDNRALDRLTKSKEAALLEAERQVEIAMAKASLVDDLQNKNQELMKQIEICQEENKILDKINRQKIAEVEKLTQTVYELEEAVLAGGAAANAVRDYRRKMQEMNEERRTLDRELARAKVSANRVAVVVANEWKDANDKVMPVKQWLEDRRFLQGEMQQLRDKLAVAERTAKSEALLKEKYLLRLKVVEEGLRATPSSNGRVASERRSVSSGRPSRRQSIGGAETMSKLSSNGVLSKRTSGSPFRTMPNSSSILLKQAKSSSSSFDGGSRSVERNKQHIDGVETASPLSKTREETRHCETNAIFREFSEVKVGELLKPDSEDFVSGVLYDLLQKEVIGLRKACHEKNQSLKDKDDAIEMLAKKVDTLNKAMEVEARKMRREVAAMEKEVSAIKFSKAHEPRAQHVGSKGPINGSRGLPARNVRHA